MRPITVNDTSVNILLVEDNFDHAELVKRNFRDHQIARITHVADGESALDYLFRRGSYTDSDKWPLPHMVLLDLRLPKVDGLEVLRKIRTADEFNDMPVVVLTTSQAQLDVDSAYSRRVNSYLVKPLDFAQFGQMMADLGRYWIDWNHYTWKSGQA